MGFLGKFFGGMSWMGYVITFLTTLIIGLSISLFWINRTNGNLKEELGASNLAIMNLVETTVHHRKEIDNLIKEIEACAGKRAAAEKSAAKAEVELHRLTIEVEGTASERAKQIKEDVESADPRCDCVVPPRAARLLIDAACDANRDTNCP